MTKKTFDNFTTITNDIEALLNAANTCFDELDFETDPESLVNADTVERLIDLAITFTHGLTEDIQHEQVKHFNDSDYVEDEEETAA